MAIRIRRVSIRRQGPMREDFSMEPGSLNLIYGRNETGKTCILEAMIHILFRTGRDTPWTSTWTTARAATVRDWEHGGEIEVTGLEDGITLFQSGGRKLEYFTSTGKGLPEDLSRLMVVRAGDTRFSDSLDGVGDDVLRTYLSGNRVLDEVEAVIRQETVKKAVISGGTIEAGNMGLNRDRLLLESEIRYLDELQLAVDETASLVVLNSLERKRRRLEDQLREMEDAKRHRAFQMYEEQRRLRLRLEDLPSEQDLIELGSDISLFRSRRRDVERLEEKLEELSPSEEDLRWIEKAGQEYLSRPGMAEGGRRTGKVCGRLLPLFVLLAAAGAFFSPELTLVSAAGALACLAVLRWGPSSRTSPEAEELRSKLEGEFRRRFDRELTDPATLQVVRQELEAVRVKYVNALEGRDGALREAEELEKRISAGFYLLSGEEARADEWDSMVEGFRRSRKELQDSITAAGNVLSTLSVPPDDSLPDPPVREWDRKEYIELRQELASAGDELESERKKLEDLKVDISMATGVNSRDIRVLITALEEKRSELVCSYRAATARILAENSVYRAVREFRGQENARLEEALDSPEIINPLHRITGRYNGIRMTEDGGLHLRAADGGEYPLSRLSTGAAEQVYISLRTGFAQLVLGEPAFLLLDDAFQHSDWVRRKNLVDHVTELVTGGWQVFYFTMDDHLRKLLDGRGRELGDDLYMHFSLS